MRPEYQPIGHHCQIQVWTNSPSEFSIQTFLSLPPESENNGIMYSALLFPHFWPPVRQSL
jgi:hypothetical protein